ncbi:MAG TPA: phosphate signaling complex protein PhoU [Thermodesulfobacteriaceae bacterium]|nr:phosphate signaling complex protein PhoU [Thermodesulfobacteriaceae bacterium]
MTPVYHYNFHRQLDKLFEKFLNLGTMVEDRVRKACESIKTGDMELIKFVASSDYEIDEMEIDIEEECLKILALYQPVARDLRIIIAMIKINNELERMGDYAVSIARRVKDLASAEITINYDPDYEEMSSAVLKMLKLALDAITYHDADMAHRVFVLDDNVDKLRNQHYERVIEEIQKQPTAARYLIDCYILARHLERIADRATNIAEEVMYVVEGEIVRGEFA